MFLLYISGQIVIIVYILFCKFQLPLKNSFIFQCSEIFSCLVFNMVSTIIKRIESLLKEIIQVQSYYVSKICPRCLDPCCGRVGYLYSDKDIIFLRLSGRKTLRKIQGHGKKGCCFLGQGGCLLDALSRPFICHQYMCSELKAAINEDNPEILNELEYRFNIINEKRSRMWTEYLDAL